MEDIKVIGVDETGIHRSQSCITVVHEPKAQRFLIGPPGKDLSTLQALKEDLVTH